MRQDGRPVFFWTTDTALRMRTVTGAAAEVIGVPFSKCEGRDLLAIFGMEGRNLAILEAHVAALEGDTVAFTLYGDRGTVRCEVAPTHDAIDRVIGTFCLALEVEDVDLRDDAVRPRRGGLSLRGRPLPAERRHGLDDPCDLVGAVRRAQGPQLVAGRRQVHAPRRACGGRTDA